MISIPENLSNHIENLAKAEKLEPVEFIKRVLEDYEDYRAADLAMANDKPISLDEALNKMRLEQRKCG